MIDSRFGKPLVAAFALVLLGAAPAWAQFNLLDAAKKMLDGGAAGGANAPAAGALSTDEIVRGLRDALKVGTERVVGRLGQSDGFNADPEIHIPLPDSLARVQKALRRVGMAKLADDVELKLNRAAEAATPRAKALFWDAIANMTLDDAKRIYDGPKDAATQYFRGRMSGPLADAMRPVVDDTLAEVGAIRSYDAMMGEYQSLPFVPDVKADLTQHVLDRALDGLFLYLAREEAAIRENPAKRTTAILRRVFGS